MLWVPLEGGGVEMLRVGEYILEGFERAEKKKSAKTPKTEKQEDYLENILIDKYFNCIILLFGVFFFF